MKRVFVSLLVLVLLAFAATPVFAQGVNGGDHFCFGGDTVVQSGETANGVVVFGCNVRVLKGASVNRDVVSFGGNVVIEDGARVGGGLVAFGGNVVIEDGARVGRDVVAFGGVVQISGEVSRNVTSFGGPVTLDSTAKVGREVISFGGPVRQEPGAEVRGRVVQGQRFSFSGLRIVNWTDFWNPFTFGGGGFLTAIGLGFLRSLIAAIALAALGALTVVFLPSQTHQVSQVAETSPAPSLGVGCLTLLAAPTLITLLVILVCTIPVAVVLVFALVIGWLFGLIALGQLVGERLLQAFKAKEILPVVAVIVGVLVLTLLGAVPFIGWIITLAVALLGIGAVVLTRFGTRPYPMTPASVAPVAPSAPALDTTKTA